jgi:antimicrobial peptide system SdpB family protein
VAVGAADRTHVAGLAGKRLCQVAVIYFDAALSKLAFPSWQRGTAVPKLLNDPQFGLPPEARSLVEEALDPTWIGAIATWAVITTELGIGCSMLFRAGIRHWGLIMAICLHSAIILAMGLFSFGLIMISLLAVASGGDLRWRAPLECEGAELGEARSGHSLAA